MIEQFQEIADAVRLEVAPADRKKIGICGAGGIVEGAHLPAYIKAGLEVVAIFDVDHEKAKQVAAKFGIARIYATIEELLADKDVEIVDIAVPAEAQPEIFARVAAAKKHILAQKPFATTVAAGELMVKQAADNGVIAAVNQQLRFEEGVAAAHKMVELGWIGEVSNFSITVNLMTPWELWPWAKNLDRLEVMLHSIHYHDLIRWFLGDAKTVFCAAGRTAGQFPKGETRTISTALYDNGVTSVVHANHVNRGGDNYAEYRIDGDKGSIRGTLGLLYDYPNGRVDTLEVNSQVLPTDGWMPYPVTTRWFPDAFIGTMGSVMKAISQNEPLRSSVAENIGTLKMVEALYASMDSGKSVDL
ncbi:MAG: Gfo/Idh/MocA family oxidoreductase [Candidatus Planktophila sp.]|jgi:predicted dehydrogenase|nr:Gfo/Idh/MocA family oxidoreductase [Candidatus Planktophila sp.]